MILSTITVLHVIAHTMSNATQLILSWLKQADAKRLLKLYFPRDDGPNAGLLVNQLVAEEAVSRDFTFTVTVLSDNAHIELKDVQCKMVCVELLREDGSSRYFNGYCFEFSLQNVENGLATYQMILKPWLAFFRLRTDYYLFHNQSIQEQSKEIFLETGMASYDMQIDDSDPVRTFSCQYDESDYNYLHRRWEEMGWHYWYEHSMNGHKLMLASHSTAAEPIDGEPEIPHHHDGGSNKNDKISGWSAIREVVSGKVALASFDFKHPTPQRVTETGTLRQGDIHKIEVYQYEGLYGYKQSAHGADMARRKMEQIEAVGKYFAAKGDSRYVQSGRWFRLTEDHAGQMFEGSAGDNEYFILTATHRATNNYLNAGGSGAAYENELTCLRRAMPWRPEPGFNSEDTRVAGIDTATVVGLAGEEIHTDAFGRIKIQLHWDRKGKNNEKSSAWVRVMTPWADSHFGMIALPRVGTEVVVQYLQGNPDRPLVIGQLYNQRHMPPWSLPANKTQSGILSRSSPGGNPTHANALRFEDKKGAEQVWLHAEKDQLSEVENDEKKWVGHDRVKTVDNDELTHIRHNRSELVGNDETITIHRNQAIDVGADHALRVAKNSKIQAGKELTQLAGTTLTVDGKEVLITGVSNIKLQCGASMIEITPGMIEILAPLIKLNG